MPCALRPADAGGQIRQAGLTGGCAKAGAGHAARERGPLQNASGWTGGAARASGFLFLTPAFVVLLSGLILGTAITPSQMIGGAMIGLSIWLINRP